MDSDDETDDQHSEAQELTTGMVRFMLNHAQSKVPIKKTDIVTHCLRGKSKLFNSVYEMASNMLKKNYGMSIYKVDGIKSGQLFICVATAANPCALAVTEAEEKTLPVLLLVLAYIYMKGGQLSDHSVLGLLEKCDIRNAETGEPHPVFGDVRKLVLDVFVKQLYLRKTKQTLEGSNDSQLTLEWGQRAELEFARRDVLEAVAKLMNRSADSFVRQHE